jgi:hypothetical protein
MSKKMDDQYSDQEAVERREAALMRMLTTPHQPHKPIAKKAKSPRPKRAAAKRGSA